MKNMKMDIYDKEVFVFTPKGDLYKLPLGASLLDFAFHIHSKLGMTCTGGKVNGKNQKLNYKLKSGDTVEILTSTAQAAPSSTGSHLSSPQRLVTRYARRFMK